MLKVLKCSYDVLKNVEFAKSFKIKLRFIKEPSSKIIFHYISLPYQKLLTGNESSNL